MNAGALGLLVTAQIVDESHLLISLRRCPACEQRFVWIFTELIDWTGGDDPQTWTILPLTDDEATRFAASRDLAPLTALAQTRDHLRIHHPRSGPPIAGYRRGALLGPHD